MQCFILKKCTGGKYMANLHNLYLKFNEKITLTSTSCAKLRTSRNALRSDIKKWFSDHDKVQPKFCWQGSFSMKTVINQLDNGEYDLDDGVYIQNYDDCEQKDWPTPNTVHQWIKKAVDRRTKADAKDKNTCVRVTYAGGYHIDLPIYIMDGDTAFLAHKSDGWIESDPKAFKDWFINKVKDENNGEQLRRLVKVLKAWKDYTGVDLKGVELTILATNAFEQYDNRDDKSFRNTVRNIIEILEDDFTCIKPVAPGEDLFERFDENQQDKIIQAFKDLKEEMDNALNEENEEKASEYLIDVFGSRFPKGTSKSSNCSRVSTQGVLRHDGRSA